MQIDLQVEDGVEKGFNGRHEITSKETDKVPLSVSTFWMSIITSMALSMRITIPKEIAEWMKLRVGDAVGVSLGDERMIVRKITK